jgi:L-asparaginase II
MPNPQPMVELWRGSLLESTHAGHAVIWGPGGIEGVWGDPGTVIFPRSSAKMIQALPLVETGAAEAAGLTDAHLAFACASHQGEGRHVKLAGDWLAGIGLGEPDLRCGAHEPYDRDERNRLIKTDTSPCQLHNNCSGKHCGFLTVTKHLKAGPEYLEIDHPLQRRVHTATEEVTGETVAGWGVDGCSAPNFAMTVAGLARAMQGFAAATGTGGMRDRAMHRLTRAMATFPELVAGEGRACTELMRAMGHKVAIKTGAEAVFVAILPDQKRGMALKVVDGGTRGAEAAITALLVQAGVLDASHPSAQKRLGGKQRNWRGLETGWTQAAPGFPG